MPLIEEVSKKSSTNSNPKKNKGKKSKSTASSSSTSNGSSKLSDSTASKLPASVMESLLSMNLGDVPQEVGVENEFMKGLSGINKAASGLGIGGAGGGDPNAPASKEQMTMAFDMLAKLEKEDPEAFDEIMTKLETDMKKQAEERGIDLEEAQKKADEFIKNNPDTPFPGAEKIGKKDEVKMPDGRKMAADGTIKNDQEGCLITPEPVFSVKTSDNKSGRKVFINVCTHEKVTEPRTVKRLNPQGEEVEGLSVPVAVSSVRIGGKGGEDTISFDCVVNQFVIDEIGKDASGGYRDFICQLVMQYVEQKSGKKVEEGGMGEGKGLVIDKRYKLPKLKYHAYVDAVTGAVIKPEDLKKAVADKTASAAKQWVREAAKGEKGISEVDASTKKKTEKAKASAAAAAKSVKVPMSNKKVPIMIGVEETDGSTMTLLDHAKSVGEKLELSDLPKPNPDGIDVSQLLMEPLLCDAPDSVKSIVISCPLRRDSGPNSDLDMAAFSASITAPGFIKTTAILPYPCVWKKATATYDAGAQMLTVRVPVMKASVDSDPDVGSRAWGLAQALGGNDDEGMPVERRSGDRGGDGTGKNDKSSGLKEDKFHLKVPKGYNQYSGEYQDGDREDEGNDTGELPEDRFHKNDIMSQHILDQQATERQKKIDKAEEERLERKKKKEEGENGDGDIEYLDVDDFKPGGKYFSGKTGSAVDEPDNENSRLVTSETLSKAATVMKDGSTDQARGDTKSKISLSSNLWTELLD
ncbi:hypothetical protein TrVE_jg7556 [Triparma verrucosa]|uniref:PIH1 N-terminal domain-containing protein n=1 Tax=Triparma verrucosa TaxID=1606542 RepID=A0A9W7BPP5_9STRA|nr:hypothetical protein TrVE_jg7556 [Triparma verrucosa]